MVNRPFQELLGWSLPEVNKMDFWSALYPDPGYRKEAREIMNQAQPGWREFRVRTREGKEINATWSNVRLSGGRQISIRIDLTEQGKLRQRMEQMQKTQALGTLAGGIAHDFNNILNPIFINTELVLLDVAPDSPMRRPLQIVLEAAERGKNLVKQIITFSRQKEQQRRPLKIEPLIREALKFLRSSLPTTVEIREKVQAETGSILAEPTQVYQVVVNLCSNAAYAMREQGGVLAVELAEVKVDGEKAQRHPYLKPGPYLRLTVSDTGRGMPPEVLERLFDPFFTTKKPGEGTGMGLSVVHGIVRNCKGAITVYSEVGKGSTFNVFFPRVEGESSSLKISPEPITAGRERILLVDDEKVQAQSIQNMLERLGYKVVAMTDSTEALSFFRKDPQAFDLVITDQTMPHMTGVRLAKELLLVRPRLPVILRTGFSDMVDADDARALGIRSFLMKPFSIWEISQSIRHALAEK